MNERDRVLDAFRNCITEPKCKDCPWTECSTLDNGSVEIPRDLALAVMRELVAQEPRVMTLEEVEALPYGYVLIEIDKSGSLRWLDALLFCKNVNFSFDFITLEGRAGLLGTEYNREWRCWTSRPDEKRREETPWG